MSSLDLSDVQLPAFDPSQLNLSDSDVLSSVTSSCAGGGFPNSLQRSIQRILSGITVQTRGGTSCYFFAHGQYCSGMELLERHHPGKTMAKTTLQQIPGTYAGVTTVSSAVDAVTCSNSWLVL